MTRPVAAVLATLTVACVEPAPPQAFLEVRDSQGIAANASAVAVGTDYLAEVVETPITITFPLHISLRAPSEAAAVVTTVAFDAANAPIAFASRAVEFSRRFQDVRSAIILELVPFAGHCLTVDDCDVAPTCVDIACEPQVLEIGLCSYAANDANCAPDATCDEEVGCVPQ